MALNRFTTLPDVKISKTQVLPRTEMILAGLERQEENYNKTASSIKDTQSELGDLKLYGEYAKMYGTAVSDAFKQKSGEIMNKDLGSSEVMSEVGEFISKISSDTELTKHIQAKESADKYLKQVEDLKKAGKWNRAQTYEYDKAWSHYSKTGEYLSGLDAATIEEGINIIDEVPKYFRDLQANGSDSIAYLAQSLGSSYSDGLGGTSDAESLKLAYKNSYKGISSGQVKEHADRVFNTFMLSNAGRQTIKEYNMLVDEGAINPKKTSPEQYLKGTLLGIGLGKVHSVTSTNMDMVQRQGEMERHKSVKENATMNVVLPSGPEAMNFKELSFDSNGKMKLSSTNGLGTRLKEVFEGKRHISDVFNGDNKGEIEEVKNHAGVLAFAKFNNISDQEAASMLSSQGNPAPNVKVYKDAKKIKEQTALFFSHGTGIFTTMNYYNPETGKAMSATDIINMAKESGGVDKKGVELSAKTPTDIRRSMEALGIQVAGKADASLYTANGTLVSIGPYQFIADTSFGGTVNTSPEQMQQHIAENIKFRGAYTNPKTGQITTLRNNKGKSEAVTLSLEELYKTR
jgi:hypothetical protein